jgi:predicted RNase H-like nuclease (RuvC/YqgF family)
MQDFWKQQFEIAERMLKVMETEHAERQKTFDLFMETSRSLLQKLTERDAEIEALRRQIDELRSGK